MRPKVVIAVFLFATVALVGILLLNKVLTPPPPLPVETASIVKTPTPVMDPYPPMPALPVQPPPPPTPVPVVTAAPVAITNEEAIDPEVISATVQKLETLEWNDDPASLQAILNELTNSSPVIRHTAIEATIQFRDRSAIPALRELAGRTEDPAEKKELLDAADFMALPTMKEAGEAMKQGKSIGSSQP